MTPQHWDAEKCWATQPGKWGEWCMWVITHPCKHLSTLYGHVCPKVQVQCCLISSLTDQRWHTDTFSAGLQIRTKLYICWMDRVHCCCQCHLCFSLIHCSALLNLLQVHILSATKCKVYCVNTTPPTYPSHFALVAQTTDCNFHTAAKN